jgi:hypothetical protein
MDTARGIEGGSDNTSFAEQSVRSPSSPERTAPLWLAAAFSAAALALGAQAQTTNPAETNPAELQAAPEQGQPRAEMLARELATARRDLMLLQTLLTNARDEMAQARREAERVIAELRKALQDERDRARRPGLEAVGSAAWQKFLKQEREHAALLEQDLAAARRERERAALLEQDLAAARQDVETQKALAGTEVSQLKKTADAGSAELRKALQQERDRATRLEQDLASARRDVETQVAFAAKASDEATKFKQAAEKGSAELRQSLQKEQEKAETLAQELAMARARIYAFEAQARQASDHAAELKQTAEGGVADLQTSLQQERDRASRLEQDVAAARREVEKQTALAAKTGEEARQMKQAADSAAELQKSLEQEQERTARLEQDVAAARRDLEKQTARTAKVSRRQSSQTKRRAESSAAELFKSNSIWNLIFAPPRR